MMQRLPVYLAIALVALAGLMYWRDEKQIAVEISGEGGDGVSNEVNSLVDESPSFFENLQFQASSVVSSFQGASVQSMVPSEELKATIKKSERLVLTRYNLGDGGWTIGYGRFYPSNGPMPPDSITRDQAETFFNEDIESRAAKWVRTFVTVDVTQQQFDSLVHIAYNLSPKSFKTIAEKLNAGGDWKAQALKFTRPDKPSLTQGLINRRNKEFAMFEQGIYA
jgi:lysozyme